MELLRDVPGDLKNFPNIALIVSLNGEGKELRREGPGHPFSRSRLKDDSRTRGSLK